MSFQSAPGIVDFTHEWREALRRHKQVCEVAVSAAGERRRIRCEDFHYRWGIVPERTARWDLLFVDSKAFAIREADGVHMEFHCSCASPPPQSKPRCEQTRGWGKPDGTGKMVGVAVEQRRVDIGEASTVIRFAPALGCEQTQVIETRHQFGLPVARSSNTVTRLRPGEPEPTRFRIPAGSKRVAGFPPERHP
jgi:hypothetical protein